MKAPYVGLLAFFLACLVWRGLKLEELPATSRGFMGGALIWISWFEFAFEHFAKAIGVDPLRYPDGSYGLPPTFAFMQATAFIVFALILFFAANKDTGCRFFQWMHRNLGLRRRSSAPWAPALRYSIGAVGIFWLYCELAALWGWYQDIWLKPFEFPVYCALQFVVFGAGIAFTIRNYRFKEAAV